MKDITADFSKIFTAFKLLVFYHSQEENREVYVESFDMDEDGKPINAHPLTLQESDSLADALLTTPELDRDFLRCDSVLPANVLQVQQGSKGFAIWYTTACRKKIFYSSELGIPDNETALPALLWKADGSHLAIFALKDETRPTEKTTLYKAPFFNIYTNGNVCMGNVNVNIEKHSSLEAFIESWQDYFFTSKFSHLIESVSPVSENIVQLWKRLGSGKETFPTELLIKAGKKLKDII